MNEFTVDIALETEWLEQALENSRKGKVARVSVVIVDAGPRVKYKARVLGAPDHEYMVVSMAGDYTNEPAWNESWR